MLRKIKAYCFKNLQPILDNEEGVFLISNQHPKKWDFPRLEKAIIDALPTHQKECLAFTLTCDTEEMLQAKIMVLRDRIWKAATASAACAMIPVPGLSIAVDFALITNELKLYKSTLGLSELFDSQQTPPEIQSLKSQLFMFNTAAKLATAIAAYSTSTAAEEWSRFIPFVGPFIAASVSFGTTYLFLRDALKELEKAAQDYVQKVKENTVANLGQ